MQDNRVKNIPLIAHMFVVREESIKEKTTKTDNSYYNLNLDFDSEYCQNTTAWD